MKNCIDIKLSSIPKINDTIIVLLLLELKAIHFTQNNNDIIEDVLELHYYYTIKNFKKLG